MVSGKSGVSTEVRKPSIRRKSLIIAIVCGALLFMLGYDLLIGGNLRFYTKWVECGQRPVGGDIKPLFEGDIPSYGSPSAFSLFRYNNAQYFCTPYQAEKAGYSASDMQYTYPHLGPNERPGQLK